MDVYSNYEAVIGLEVHVQLLTESKAYSSDPAEYGGLPNSHVSVISLGHPGTLPRTNEKVIEFAIRLGLATHSTIRERNEYARKNYFYADLPKGYQITQDKTPVCTGGFIPIRNPDGTVKHIALTRIHMEEDAGKSMHDMDPSDTLIDLNRAGVPLLEMVSEPVIKSGEEAYRYLSEVRKLVRYLDICDGNMEEGSLRCDANISVMPRGSVKFGRRVEVKNMNSMRNVQRAIEYEIKRQIDLIEKGETVVQDTRNFDAVAGVTLSMRTKEAANDYRYFPEPDLPPLILTEKAIAAIKAELPALPGELYDKYTNVLHLSAYDAMVLTEIKSFALYFEELIKHTTNYKGAANWMMGAVRSALNEISSDIRDFKISPSRLAELIGLVDEGKVSNTAASQSIFPLMLIDTNKSPLQIAEENNLVQERDQDALLELVRKAVAKYPEKVAEYKSGKAGLIGLFMGELMKLSNGKADPKTANAIMRRVLEEEGAKSE